MKMRELADMAPWDWPQTASVSILEVLRDPEAPSDEREVAVELAGDLVVMNDDLARELLGILEDPSEPDSLRGRAAIAFGAALEDAETADAEAFDEWDTPALSEAMLQRIKDALRTTFHNLDLANDIRRYALEASARAPEPWHADAVMAAYREEDFEWKLTAVFCMRFVPGFEAEIVEALESDDPMVFFQAVQASRDQEVPRAWPRIRELVQAAASGKPLLPDDPELDRATLMTAMHAVAMIRPDKAEEVLSEFFDSDDEDLAEVAMEALEVAQVFLLEEEEEEEDPTVWN